jgi:hypothetical protein
VLGGACGWEKYLMAGPKSSECDSSAEGRIGDILTDEFSD